LGRLLERFLINIIQEYVMGLFNRIVSSAQEDQQLPEQMQNKIPEVANLPINPAIVKQDRPEIGFDHGA
jgi:hypothetical protein